MCLPYWFCATVPFSYIPAAVLSLWQAKFQDQNKSPNCPEVQNIKKDIHDKTDPIGAPECGYDDCGVDQHGDQEFLLGGLRACFTWTQIDVQNDQDIQGQINAPVPDMAVGNYCAKLADDKKSRKRFLKLFFENICPAILKPPLRIDLSIIPAEGVEREEKMRKFLWNVFSAHWIASTACFNSSIAMVPVSR